MPIDNLQVGQCRSAEIFADPAAAALFEEYARECANPVIGAISPQPDLYASLEQAGYAQCFAAYRNGHLCGFAFLLTSALPHYGRKFASVESLFVARSDRESNLGAMLMAAVNNFAREAGCEAILYSAPIRSRLCRLLSLLPNDYTETNRTFCRRLV